MYVFVCIYPTLPHQQEATKDYFFSGVRKVLTQGFPPPT